MYLEVFLGQLGTSVKWSTTKMAERPVGRLKKAFNRVVRYSRRVPDREKMTLAANNCKREGFTLAVHIFSAWKCVMRYAVFLLRMIGM